MQKSYEVLDKISNQLYCKSINEIEESINKGLTGETKTIKRDFGKNN